MKKTNKIIAILLLIIIVFSNLANIYAKNLESGDILNLKFDHDCISVLKIKDRDQLKQVAYVCYVDPETGTKYPAFCIQPGNEGIGTGAGDNYDVKLNELNSPHLWRMLYYGYVGNTFDSWGLDCDDDLYFATKTAVHCFAEGIAPKDKYEIPHRVGYGDNVTLCEVQERGAKVLEVAQRIFEFGYTNSDNYVDATLEIAKGEGESLEIDGIRYLIENYTIVSNRELKSYNINIYNFPEGTKIFNSANLEIEKNVDSNFKIAIPENSLTENFTGIIKVYDAEIKFFPIFYCTSGSPTTQDYIISEIPRTLEAQAILSMDVHQSTLKIIKSNEENKPVSGVVFNLKYSDGTEIGDYTTDENGIISVSKLKPDIITVTEKNTPEKYVLDSASKNVSISFNSIATLNVTNNLKKGNLKIVKVDKDNNKIGIPNVEFELLDENKKNIGKYITDKNGEILINNLNIGNYYIRETKENSLYYPLKEDIKIQIEYNKTLAKVIQNEKLKGEIEVYKVDSENNTYKLENVVFDVLDSNKNKVETITTNEEGYAKTKRLPIGTYYLKEIKTQDKYLLNKELIKLEVKQDKVTSKTITNDNMKGQIRVIKVDSQNNETRLKGVKFEVLDKDNNLLEEIITNENGEALTSKYALKDFSKLKIREKETLENYILIDEIQVIELEENQIKDIIFENERKPEPEEQESNPEPEMPKLPRTGF